MMDLFCFIYFPSRAKDPGFFVFDDCFKLRPIVVYLLAIVTYTHIRFSINKLVTFPLSFFSLLIIGIL